MGGKLWPWSWKYAFDQPFKKKFIAFCFYPFDDGHVFGLSDLTTTYFNIDYPIYK